MEEKNYDKYIELCGEIDAQINIPELVGEKNLCPHQDFIYLNVPTKEQENKINEYRSNSIKIIKWFENNQNIIKAIATHKFILDYQNNIDEIIENYETFLVMIKFLNSRNIFVHKYIKDLNKKIGPMLVSDYEKLFEYILYENDNEFKIIENSLKELKSMLLQVGAIDKGNINLLYNKELEKVLSQNMGKLKSINDIVKHEYNCLKEKLKLVIVTDYIIDDYSDFDDSQLNQIGVIPIFKNIIENMNFIKVCVLTGSTIIIPTDVISIFMEICKNYNIKDENVSICEIGEDFKYSRVNLKNDTQIVKIITDLFKKTDISVLIGTVALIGEGWDAPFVNTLIMASSISSYVTSNQIRGRAIRIDKENMAKEANIWHLVCLEKCGDKYIKGKDFEKIQKRFNAIEGLDIKEDTLTSSIKRFNLFDKSFTYKEVVNINKSMLDESKKRDIISKRWEIALKDYTPLNRLFVQRENILKNKKLIYNKDVNFVSKFCVISIVTYFLFYNYLNNFFKSPMAMLIFLAINLGVIKRTIKNKNFDRKALKTIAKTICTALKQNNLLNENSYIKIKSMNNQYEITLVDADIHSQNLFMKCLKEAISKEGNSRYILLDNDKAYNIPYLFDKNKESAEFFKNIYNKINHCFNSQIIYSKNGKGKLEKIKLLLKQENSFKGDEQEIFDGNVDVKWLSLALGVDNDLGL